MRAALAAWAIGLTALAIGALPGCGRPPAPPAEWRGAGPSAREIADSIRERSDALSTLRAVMEIRFLDTERGEAGSCRASLLFARPGLIRLRGTSASFFTVFELVAGAEEIWIDVPREHKLVFGRRSDPGWDDLPLSPEALLVALLADPCPGEPCLEGELRLERAGEDFRVEGPGFSVTVSGKTGLPTRYDGRSAKPFEIHWRDWALRGGVAWPHEVEIRPLEGEASVVVGLGRVLVGRKVSTGLFTFEPEEDREILSPREARDMWRHFVE
jgi:hypothetical protein